MSKNVLQAVDFFCSAGGVSCGFRQAGIHILGGIDWDGTCKSTYEINNNGKFLQKDVSNLSKEFVGKYFGIRRNQRNLVFVGCSPCQYYSNIQTNKAKSEKSRLLLDDFREFVEYYRPGFVFIENVPGLDKKAGSPLSKFKESLRRMGYVYDDGILNAKDYGVPQNRKRYILLATRVRNKISLPSPDPGPDPTVFKAIGDLKTYPPIGAGHKDQTRFLHSTSELKEVNMTRIMNTPHDGGDRRSWPKKLQPKCYENHDGHYDVYGRMFWQKPAPTITTKFNSYSNGRYGHPDQNRAISLREGATLQSFPADYIFDSTSQGQIARMIGNAVPPRLAQKIAESLLSKN